ncbi:putative cysteine-rich motor neuron 1 protein isoform X2 [Apostichopus japonicus]|uniref:Putative cysteine-rich motor neuron 1 protein isoform X2 n=1 Tax=Stichopus japonicus TaxID=307972 RepID=A0A2G8JWG6_STIJA|nr:putative cysteine-rich motor neuron 1 protein isoform X2 [Apostichopus japonicus]
MAQASWENCNILVSFFFIKTENVTDCSGVVCNVGPQQVCPEGTKTIMGGLSEDGCCLLPSRCDCDPGQCMIPTCWAGYSPRRMGEAAGVPGECCDEYECVAGIVTEGCTHREVSYSDGERWQVDDNGCKECECRQGMAHCTVRQDCYQQLCVVDGGFREPGDRWVVDDCTTCECRDGDVACTTASCRLECLEPRIVPVSVARSVTNQPLSPCPLSIVCPYMTVPWTAPPVWSLISGAAPLASVNQSFYLVCSIDVEVPPPSTTLSACQDRDCSGQSCENGFALDLFGCPTCQCLEAPCPGTDMCAPCISGYRVDEKGCETCRCIKCPSMESCHKFCPYGYQRGKNHCVRCRCEKCPPLERCSKQCVHGRETNDRGCEICKCKNSTASPTRPSSSHGCKTSGGLLYSDGESWNDGCRECFCHDGREMCALISCPVPNCEQPVIRPNFCCPVCLGATPTFIPPVEPKLQVCHSLEGHFYVEGETWYVDSCTICVCHNGHVLCSIQECPPLPCHSPVHTEGHCCGTCPDDNSGGSESGGLIPCVLPENQFFPSGAAWKDDDCTSCQCNNGLISCFHQSCPPAECDKPVLRKGQCCASCIKTPTVSVCEYADEIYMDGDTWYASTCVTCSCREGSIYCSEAECPPLDCEGRILLEGACCPSCIEKDHKGTTGFGSAVTSKPQTSKSKPFRPNITPRIPDSEENEQTTKPPSLGNHPPAAFNDSSGSPILLILCILLSCIVILLLLLVLIKRKHRLLYNVNQKQMPIKQPEDPAVTIMSIKPKNTDVAKQSNHEPVRDSIRDSKVFKENLANKVNNVTSKLDGYEIKYSDKFAGNKIDQV